MRLVRIWPEGQKGSNDCEVIHLEHPVPFIKLVVPAEHLGEVVNPECKGSFRDDLQVECLDLLVGCLESSVECCFWHGESCAEHHLPALDAEPIPSQEKVEQEKLMVAFLTGIVGTD